MPYATQSDLVPLRLTAKELVELTDDSNSGNVNTAVVNQALEEASGKVESYCRGRYVTPLQPSDTVKALTVDIAIYLLFSRRRNIKVGETIRQRYEDAGAFLKDIAAGKAQLDQPQGQTPQGSTAGPVVSAGSAIPADADLRFSDDNMRGFS